MFVKKYFLPILSLIGIIFGLYMVVATTRKPPVAPIAFPPPIPPFSSYIAGSGIIEASSENIAIGTPFNELVEKVFVNAGDQVKKGTAVFQLNVETLESKRNEAYARYKQAKIALEEEKSRFSFYEKLQDKQAVSKEEYNTRFYALLEKKAALALVKKTLMVIETNIERSTVKAPIDGQVLQVNLRVGENAQTTALRQANRALILFGDVQTLHVRIDIDESDAWRYKKNSRAYAFIRGNSAIRIPLDYVRLEPYIIPKQSLTGDRTERVDTRVLQVVYKFKKENYPVYIGEILDVYMETTGLEGKRA